MNCISLPFSKISTPIEKKVSKDKFEDISDKVWNNISIVVVDDDGILSIFSVFYWKSIIANNGEEMERNLLQFSEYLKHILSFLPFNLPATKHENKVTCSCSICPSFNFISKRLVLNDERLLKKLLLLRKIVPCWTQYFEKMLMKIKSHELLLHEAIFTRKHCSFCFKFYCWSKRDINSCMQK